LAGKLERKARKQQIIQEMINKMDWRRKWKNVNDEGCNVREDELGWKENHGIKNIGIEDSKANIILY
jgi:hypothetical protein